MTAIELEALVQRLVVDERRLEAELRRARTDLAWARLEQVEDGRPDRASIRRSLRRFLWDIRDGGNPATRHPARRPQGTGTAAGRALNRGGGAASGTRRDPS